MNINFLWVEFLENINALNNNVVFTGLTWHIQNPTSVNFIFTSDISYPLIRS